MSRTNCAIGKDYVPASFKGVQFLCTEADVEGGRRGAEGEFPFGEQTAYADLGRRIRVYKLSAVFREDDHVSDAQALFDACESTGPGILVHPTRGTVMVACRHCKLTDKIEDEQGQTHAELEFVEANEQFGGFGGSLFGIISDGLFAASQTSFFSEYTPLQVSQPWRNDVIHRAQSLVQAVHDVAVQTTPIDAPLSQLRVTVRMQEVAHDDGLAADPNNIDVSLVNGFQMVASNIADPTDEFNAMRKLANAAATRTPGLPVGTAQESEEAVLSRHRVLAAIGMAQAAMARSYNTVDEAIRAMDQVLVVLHDEMQLAYDDCNNEVYLELRNYAQQFASMMYDLAYRLPPVLMFDFAGGVHPLVAAYAIYKDAKRLRELEQRNILDANGRFGPIVVGLGQK